MVKRVLPSSANENVAKGKFTPKFPARYYGGRLPCASMLVPG
jgi:hypothetical protein